MEVEELESGEKTGCTETLSKSVTPIPNTQSLPRTLGHQTRPRVTFDARDVNFYLRLGTIGKLVFLFLISFIFVGRCGSVPCVRKVAVSDPTLVAISGQVLHSQLPIALRRVNSDTVSLV